MKVRRPDVRPSVRSVQCLVAIASLTACSHAGRQSPVAAIASPQPAPARHTEPYRPLHKGHVDLSTGLYVREDDDLFVETALPMVLRRTYRTQDRVSRRFGVGANHPGEWWLYGDGDPRCSWADLILAGGGRIHFTRISPGDSQESAVLRHDGTPTNFGGALLRWNGSKWRMEFADGSSALFLDCQSDDSLCSLVQREDAQGHRIEYVRDASLRLLRMESEGQQITFDYDDRKRIAHAADTSGHSVTYTYDDRDRLVRSAGSDGATRTYAYDDEDRLTAIHEPGRIVENWYDQSGRWSRQVVRFSEDDDEPYIASARYVVDGTTIVETDFDEGDGLKRYRYNRDRYVVSETFDADSPNAATFTYDRDAVTNEIASAALSCGTAESRVVRVGLSQIADEQKKWMAIQANCPRHQ